MFCGSHWTLSTALCCWVYLRGYRQRALSRLICLPLNQPCTNDFVSVKSQWNEAHLLTLPFCILPFRFFLLQAWVKNRPPYCPTVVFMCKLSLCMSAKCLLWMHSIYLEWLQIANPMAGHCRWWLRDEPLSPSLSLPLSLSLSLSLSTKPTILPRLHSLTPNPWLTTKFCLTQTNPVTSAFQIFLWSACGNLANDQCFGSGYH